jgi:hypothetical protein
MFPRLLTLSKLIGHFILPGDVGYLIEKLTLVLMSEPFDGLKLIEYAQANMLRLWDITERYIFHWYSIN